MNNARQLANFANNRLAKRWLSLAITVLGAGGLFFYIVSYGRELVRLEQLTLTQILLLALLTLVGHLLSALKFKLSAKLFSVNLPTSDAFMLVESGTLINFVPFLATGFRALYLKRVHSLRYVDFGMSTFALIIATFASAGFWGLLGLMQISMATADAPSGFLTIVFAGYLFGPVAVLVAAWIVRQRLEDKVATIEALPIWLQSLLNGILSGIDIISRHPGALVKFFVLSLAANLSVSVRFWLIGMWLGYPVGFAAGLVMWNLNQITTVFALIPSGAIGFREALTGLGATGLGATAISGVLISSVDRIVTLLLTLVVGTISLLILRRRVVDNERSSPVSGAT